MDYLFIAYPSRFPCLPRGIFIIKGSTNERFYGKEAQEKGRRGYC